MNTNYEALEETLGYTFKNTDKLIEALTHRSYGSKHNQRLEFLGDSALGMVIVSYIYSHFPTATDSQMTRMKASVVSKRPLASLEKHYGFGKYLLLGAGERAGGSRRESMMEDLVEALIGAIYEDLGFNLELLTPIVLKLFHPLLVNLTMDDKKLKDPKNRPPWNPQKSPSRST